MLRQSQGIMVKQLELIPQFINKGMMHSTNPSFIEMNEPGQKQHEFVIYTNLYNNNIENMKRISLISSSIYQISTNKYDNFGKIIFLNTVIFVNISFGLASFSIIPEIADQNGYESLGQLINLLQYLFSLINNIFGIPFKQKFIHSTIISKINELQNLFFYTCFVRSLTMFGWNVKPLYYITLCSQYNVNDAITYTGSIILGSLSGVFYGGLWVAQNLYISECSNDSNRSLFFGVSNSLSNASQIIGSLISIFLIQPLGDKRYFYLLTVKSTFINFLFQLLSLVSQFLFLFVLEPPGKVPLIDEAHYQQTQLQKQQIITQTKKLPIQEFESYSHAKETYTMKNNNNSAPLVDLSGNQKDRTQSALLERDGGDQDNSQIHRLIEERKAVLKRRNTLIQQKKDHEVNEFFYDLPISQQMKQVWEVAIGEKVRPLIPYMFSTGVVIGFEYAIFYQIISQSIQHSDPSASPAVIQTKTFIVFGAQGIAEVCGGLAIGWIGQIYLLNFTSILQNGCIMIALFLSFSNCWILNFNLNIVLGFIWLFYLIFKTNRGFADCAGQANCMSLLSEDWGDDIRVFGFYNFLQNAGALIAILISIMLGNNLSYVFIYMFFAWMQISNFCLSFYRRTRRVKDYE